jgi:hypothetical protein
VLLFFLCFIFLLYYIYIRHEHTRGDRIRVHCLPCTHDAAGVCGADLQFLSHECPQGPAHVPASGSQSDAGTIPRLSTGACAHHRRLLVSLPQPVLCFLARSSHTFHTCGSCTCFCPCSCSCTIAKTIASKIASTITRICTTPCVRIHYCILLRVCAGHPHTWLRCLRWAGLSY